MSVISRNLDKSNEFQPFEVLPSNLRPKQLVVINQDCVMCLVEILRPGQNIHQFYSRSFFKKHITPFLPSIPTVRMEVYVFLMDMEGQLFMDRYHPMSPVKLLCWVEDINNVSKGMDMWDICRAPAT